jgi:hypothetical protein
MNPQMVDIIDRFFKGEFNDNPIVKRLYSMVEGKSDSDKFKILVNMLQSQGFDINQKIFSEADLKRWGIPIPNQK